MVEDTKQLRGPYAPAANVLTVIEQMRDRGLPETVGLGVTCPPRTGPSTELENLCRYGRRGRGMSKRKRYAAEEIIAKLREAEVHLAQAIRWARRCASSG